MNGEIRIKNVMTTLQKRGFDVDYKKAAVIVCALLIATMIENYPAIETVMNLLDVNEEQAFEVLKIAEENY